MASRQPAPPPIAQAELWAFEEAQPDPSIEDYAAVGDCHTLAPLSRFDSIAWWCLPDFSGPSLFAALLDRDRGDRFALTPQKLLSTRLTNRRATCCAQSSSAPTDCWRMPFSRRHYGMLGELNTRSWTIYVARIARPDAA